MPKGCLTKLCIECDWHVTPGGKLDCNYQNRLGLGKPTIQTFGGESEEEVAKRALKVAEEKAEKAKKALAELEKLKEKTGTQEKIGEVE